MGFDSYSFKNLLAIVPENFKKSQKKKSQEGRKINLSQLQKFSSSRKIQKNAHAKLYNKLPQKIVLRGTYAIVYRAWNQFYLNGRKNKLN